MPDTIPNLWPEEFKVNVQSPLTILRVQAEQLGKVTRGILAGTVETETSKERVQHRLVVIAPAYNGYRHTLIVATHDANLPYPTEVRAEGLGEERSDRYAPPHPMLPDEMRTVYPRAYDDGQMQNLVQRALTSAETRAVILSLIAKSNEVQVSPPEVAQVSKGNTDTRGVESPLADAGTDSMPKE